MRWKYFYSWILQKSYLYKASTWPEVLYQPDLAVTRLQVLQKSPNSQSETLSIQSKLSKGNWLGVVLNARTTKETSKPLSAGRFVPMQHLLAQCRTYLSESLV